MDKLKKLRNFIRVVFGKPTEERYLGKGSYEIEDCSKYNEDVFVDCTEESEEYKRGYRDGYEKKGLKTCCFSCSIGDPCEKNHYDELPDL